MVQLISLGQLSARTITDTFIFPSPIQNSEEGEGAIVGEGDVVGKFVAHVLAPNVALAEDPKLFSPKSSTSNSYSPPS